MNQATMERPKPIDERIFTKAELRMISEARADLSRAEAGYNKAMAFLVEQHDIPADGSWTLNERGFALYAPQQPPDGENGDGEKQEKAEGGLPSDGDGEKATE